MPAVVFVVAGCASGTGPTADVATNNPANSDNAAVGGDQPFVAAATPVSAADPILAIVTAADIDPNGEPVEPADVFAPSAQTITFVARIGDVAGNSTLDVSWSRVDGTSKVPLFTHSIPVVAGDIAFSQGVSTGSLAVGRYDIDAAIGSARATTFVMVLDGPRASGFVRVPPTTAQTSDGSAPLPTPPPGAQPPASGDSGVRNPPSQQAPATTGCQLTLTGDGANATLDATGCTNKDVTEGAAGPVTGALTIIDPAIKGDALRFWSVDPCKVGASDLPDAQIRYAAQIVSGTNAGVRREVTGTIPKDTTAPHIAFTSVPASDDLALAGSTVVLTADAVDGTGSGVGASGIASIEILDPAGKDVGEPSHFDGPRSCDKSRLAKRITASYTVPQDPPPVFILTVVAIDFAGNKQQVAASYVTTAAWDGVIFARTVAVVPGTTCRQSWQVTFSIVADANGAVTGSGDATPMSPPSCPIDPSVITSDEAVSVSGTFDGKMFHIHFDLGAGGGYDTGLHVLWFPTPVIIDIRWGAANAGSGTADLNITNDVGELAGLPASASLNGYIQLLLKRPGG